MIVPDAAFHAGPLVWLACALAGLIWWSETRRTALRVLALLVVVWCCSQALFAFDMVSPCATVEPWTWEWVIWGCWQL